ALVALHQQEFEECLKIPVPDSDVEDEANYLFEVGQTTAAQRLRRRPFDKQLRRW
ncbi:unnamed protein product, partial [Symbiodinium natans]